MRPNILITSAGRRGKLLQAFQSELESLVPVGKVYAADARPGLSVACHLANRAFTVPRADDPTYSRQLLDLCIANEIGLVVPTIDPELPILARCRGEFARHGIVLAVSDARFVDTSRDKRITAEWFRERGLQTPRAINSRADVQFPLFAKPYDGSCSKGAQVIADAAQLTAKLLDDPRMMFTEYLSPAEHDEYTLDMYFSDSGQLKCIVPRLRMETRGGEVSKGRTTRIAAMPMLRERFGNVPGARGCITMQIFVHRQSPAVYGIEINARFGGGYPLAYEAGANFPRWLIEEHFFGVPNEFFDDWESDLTMLRYDEHVVVRLAAA
jgi:carbamoyl-phosphate synthase large subunit